MDEPNRIDPDHAAVGGMLPRVLGDLERHRDDHRFLLILSCGFAELMVGTLIEERCKHGKRINGNTRDFPFSVRLTLLQEMGLLDEPHFRWFNWLRKQRNAAAHQPGFRFTADCLPEWGGGAHRSPDQLFSLCADILSAFWNLHAPLFRERLPHDA